MQDTGDTVLTNAGAYLAFTFKQQSVPKLVEDTAHAPLAIAVRLTNLVFRFKTETMDPSALRLALHASTNQHTWTRNLPLPSHTNWVTYNVPIAYDGTWSIGPGGSEALFNSDLSKIDDVGITVRRHGALEAQAFAIDDVTLQGLAITPGDLDGDGMLDVWEDLHALDSGDPSDAAEDDDGDGMSNFAEFRAGTIPTNALSVFWVDIQEDQGGGQPVEGVVLRWASISNRTYTVWRSLKLGQGDFDFVEQGINATPPENEYTDRAITNAIRQFYFIEVDP
jgi:hypothetical protein